jgi:hypothetical protein
MFFIAAWILKYQHANRQLCVAGMGWGNVGTVDRDRPDGDTRDNQPASKRGTVESLNYCDALGHDRRPA